MHLFNTLYRSWGTLGAAVHASHRRQGTANVGLHRDSSLPSVARYCRRTDRGWPGADGPAADSGHTGDVLGAGIKGKGSGAPIGKSCEARGYGTRSR